ncbi:protein kinase [Myxococcota bacterium]
MSDRLKQLEMVGCGAMAEVFRGALVGEHGTSRQVAIKRLRPELRQDPAAVDLFVNEARIATRLSHPNVVHAHELTRDEDGYALVCEWLDCASLAELADKGIKLPPPAVVHVGRSVCNALQYLHKLEVEDGSPLGLVHRDVTPANVFLTRSGQVKLGDFGVAWCAGEATAMQAVAGTPEFSAPEQTEGNDIDSRVDIYGLGATLRAVSDTIPEDLEEVLDRACAESRDDRFATANDFEAALYETSNHFSGTSASHHIAEMLANCGERVIRTTTVAKLDGPVQSILGDALTSTDQMPRPTQKMPRRHGRAIVGLVILACVAGLYIWLSYREGQREALATARSQSSRSLQGRSSRSSLSSPASSSPGKASRAGLSKAGGPGSPGSKHSPGKTRPVRAPIDRVPIVVRKPTGSVNLNSVPWAQVFVDGKEVGNTPLRAISLTQGRHLVRLEHPPQKLKRVVVIEVDAGITQTFLVNLRRGSVEKRKHKKP